MDRVKSYSGSITEDTETKPVKKYYGASSNVTAKKGKTELLNNKLLEFLTECGAGAEYDGEFLWVNGVPLVFYFSGTYAYYMCFTPFYDTALFGSSSNTAVFNKLDYNFKFRLLGEPTSAFVLLISTNAAAPTFSSSFHMRFYKAENILSKRESRLYWNISSNGNIAGIDLDEKGTPVDIGRCDGANSTHTLQILAADFENNKNKYPLVGWMPHIFRVDGCYYNLQNDPLPKAASVTSDAQTFIKIGGNVYYRPQYGPLIRCIT